MHSNATLSYTNETITNATFVRYKGIPIKYDVMFISSSTIASVGIIANFTVVIAFLNHKTFRSKIPNMFIINQVSGMLT